ncbi:MAG: hypothetical protein ACT4P2_12635 [Pseudomonadota bacterium]
MQTPIHPGAVEWSGENPGIYLKDTEDGPWVSLSLFFRVVISACGRGHGVIVLAKPFEAEGLKANNFCITDNRKLMDYLVSGFVSKFASFRQAPGLGAMTYLDLESASSAGDALRSYAETVTSAEREVTLQWHELGEPLAAEVPAAMGPTGAHDMYSVFQEAKSAAIVVDGKNLAGRAVTRDFLGRRMSTAFLAFSETWIRRAGT